MDDLDRAEDRPHRLAERVAAGCPEFEGRRERALAFEVQNRVFPLSHRYPEWFGAEDTESAPLAVEGTLPAAVERASLAFVRRSGLHYLQTLRPLAETFQVAYDGTADLFADAVDLVRAQGADVVIETIVEELSALMDQVGAERGPCGVPGDVAARVLDNLEGAGGAPVVDRLLGIKALAVQWTHDPTVAASLLARGSDG